MPKRKRFKLGPGMNNLEIIMKYTLHLTDEENSKLIDDVEEIAKKEGEYVINTEEELLKLLVRCKMRLTKHLQKKVSLLGGI